jgi:hypothetical protein
MWTLLVIEKSDSPLNVAFETSEGFIPYGRCELTEKTPTSDNVDKSFPEKLQFYCVLVLLIG